MLPPTRKRTPTAKKQEEDSFRQEEESRKRVRQSPQRKESPPQGDSSSKRDGSREECIVGEDTSGRDGDLSDKVEESSNMIEESSDMIEEYCNLVKQSSDETEKMRNMDEDLANDKDGEPSSMTEEAFTKNSSPEDTSPKDSTSLEENDQSMGNDSGVGSEAKNEGNPKSNAYRKHCQYCGKYVTNVTYHERTHTNERPFKCLYCPDAFRQPSGLDGHLAKVHNILATPLVPGEKRQKRKYLTRKNSAMAPGQENAEAYDIYASHADYSQGVEGESSSSTSKRARYHYSPEREMQGFEEHYTPDQSSNIGPHLYSQTQYDTNWTPAMQEQTALRMAMARSRPPVNMFAPLPFQNPAPASHHAQQQKCQAENVVMPLPTNSLVFARDVAQQQQQQPQAQITQANLPFRPLPPPYPGMPPPNSQPTLQTPRPTDVHELLPYQQQQQQHRQGSQRPSYASPYPGMQSPTTNPLVNADEALLNASLFFEGCFVFEDDIPAPPANLDVESNYETRRVLRDFGALGDDGEGRKKADDVADGWEAGQSQRASGRGHGLDARVQGQEHVQEARVEGRGDADANAGVGADVGAGAFADTEHEHEDQFMREVFDFDAFASD